jgi:hypothetical protein
LARSDSPPPPARLGTPGLARRIIAGWRVASIWGISWVLGEVVLHAAGWIGIVSVRWPHHSPWWGVVFLLFTIATAIVGFTVGLLFSAFVSFAERRRPESQLTTLRGAAYGMIAGALAGACLAGITASVISPVATVWIALAIATIPRFAFWGALSGAGIAKIGSAGDRHEPARLGTPAATDII